MNDLDLFAAALEIQDPQERASYLQRACADRPELRERIEKLLNDCAPDAQPLMSTVDAAHPATPLATPMEDEGFAPTVAHDGPVGGAPSVPQDSVIAGRYTLVREIGEGGMGSVYLAKQSEPVKRDVALKLIKYGADSKAVLARFEAERQALAMMDHPGIARVYDGGSTDAGQPFFVMELVKGVPITEYCDEQRLDVQARLELFVLVCQAVQHAHQKGVIHRDLKPGNVLVTEVDGRPTPKVIDFGVAKAIEQKLTDQTLVEVGAIVGTPAYMSPEQADPAGQDIDTRTDVYALGVMLYELLVGAPPLEPKQFHQAAILEMLRMVREVDPPRPSTKLTTSDAVPEIAARRAIEPLKLTRLLRGELDWVVMKALEKDRDRRYESASALGRDLRRHLDNEVVEARPPSAVYRWRKFVGRNKGVVTAAGAVLIALVVAAIGAAYGLVEAGRKQLAEQARDVQQAAAEQLAHIEYGKSMQVAHAWSERDVALSEDILKNAREDLRGWEWDYVDGLCRRYLFEIDVKRVTCCDFSPDDERMVLATVDGMVCIWGLQSETKALEWKAHDDFVSRALFSPDGARACTCSQDHTVKVWDAQSGELLRRIDFEKGIGAVSWSPDGTKLGVAARRMGLVYDVATGDELLALKSGKGEVTSVEFSGDGLRIATSSNDGQLGFARLWDAESGEELQYFAGHRHWVPAVVLNHDGSRVVTCSRDQTAGIWDAGTGDRLHTLQGHSGRLTSVALSPDGRRVLTTSKDRTARLWDLESGKELRVFRGHPELISCGAFSADGSRVATCGMKSPVKVWGAKADRAHRRLRDGKRDRVMFGAYSHDGSLLAFALRESGAVELWDAAKGTEQSLLQGHTGIIRTAAFHPRDSTRLLTSSDDKTARLWDAETGAEIQTFQGHTDIVWTAWFNADGSRMVTASEDKTAKVWDVASGAELLTITTPDSLRTAAFSPDGKSIVTAGSDQVTRIHAADSGQVVHEMRGHESNIWCAAFRQDGQQVVTAGGDKTARLWDAETGEELWVLRGHSDAVCQWRFRRVPEWRGQGADFATGAWRCERRSA